MRVRAVGESCAFLYGSFSVAKAETESRRQVIPGSSDMAGGTA